MSDSARRGRLTGGLTGGRADDRGLTLSLSARARQFSSFLVLVGRVSGAGLFDPQFGMIVQNKDEVTIPLDLETIPSAGEFKAGAKAARVLLCASDVGCGASDGVHLARAAVVCQDVPRHAAGQVRARDARRDGGWVVRV